jgi:hypothetical protein
MVQLLNIIQHRMHKSVTLYLWLNAGSTSMYHSSHTLTDQCNNKNINEMGFL